MVFCGVLQVKEGFLELCRALEHLPGFRFFMGFMGGGFYRVLQGVSGFCQGIEGLMEVLEGFRGKVLQGFKGFSRLMGL